MERSIDYFPPIPSSEILLTHFLRSPVLDLNSSFSPLLNSAGIQSCHAVPHSWFISPCGSYLGIVHILAWF